MTAAAYARLWGDSGALIDNIDLGSIATGELLGNGSYLAKSADGPDSATIYLMEAQDSGWTKRPITLRGFGTCGFNASLEKAVPQAVLDQASVGDQIDY